jgi:tRNA G18 (ribose-2'-O)-methylase SpoU
VAWSYHNTTLECVEELRANGYKIIAIEQIEGSTMLNDFRAEEGTKYALVFGNEVEGVDQAIADVVDGAIEIPQVGIKHSLNVSVSAGILMWEMFRQYKR